MQLLCERRENIIAKIIKERTVKVSDLVKMYNVSIETIRRDLEYLEKKGYLKRVYGGAVLQEIQELDSEIEFRKIEHYYEKQAIGKKTSELIDDGDTIFINNSSTAIEVAKFLNEKRNLNVITNSIKVASLLINSDNIHVILLGGEINKNEYSVRGFLCEENINYFHANKAIVGAGGLTLERGITDNLMEEGRTSRSMIERADKLIVVADHSKFGQTAMNTCCPVNRIWTLVTDWSTPENVISQYRSAGINVLVAPLPVQKHL